MPIRSRLRILALMAVVVSSCTLPNVDNEPQRWERRRDDRGLWAVCTLKVPVPVDRELSVTLNETVAVEGGYSGLGEWQEWSWSPRGDREHEVWFPWNGTDYAREFRERLPVASELLLVFFYGSMILPPSYQAAVRVDLPAARAAFGVAPDGTLEGVKAHD